MDGTPNYQETTFDGVKRWTRSYDVAIKHPKGGTPFMILSEELAYEFGDGDSFTRPCSNIMVSFDVSNPLHLQMYYICNAIYVEERDKRDNPPVEPPA